MSHRNTLEQFWNRVDKSAGDEACWLWTSTLIPDGYGRFKMNGQFYLAHRLALGLSIGRTLRWDEEVREEACHTCDNPPCVNPRHLYVGDHLANMADAVARGRAVSPLAEQNAAKSACPQGHEYTEDNTYWHEGRHCRTCRNAANRRFYQRVKESCRDDATSIGSTSRR